MGDQAIRTGGKNSEQVTKSFEGLVINFNGSPTVQTAREKLRISDQHVRMGWEKFRMGDRFIQMAREKFQMTGLKGS